MISLKFITPLFIFAFLGTAYSSPHTPNHVKAAQSIEELQIQLENVLKERQVPGMSIAIVHKEGPEWVAGLGKADLAHDRAATATTLFRIGSVSKGFVSLAVLMLANEGKLSLEDPIQKLAPEVWFDNKWEATDPVRMVHLLENTTGWDDMHLCEFAKNTSTMSFLEALNCDHSSRISRWSPGTRMSYCNSGPAVAAYIVEKISGQSFEAYVEQKFFKPIGMQTATYFQPAAELATTLYRIDGKTPLPYWHLPHRAIGAINASANDMANYLLFYLNRGHVGKTQIIPAATFNRIEFPNSTWAAREGLRLGYGLSNYATIHDGFIYHGHDGNVPGGLTALAYLPTEGVGYFYSLNSGNREAFKMVGKMVRAYITRQLPKPPTPPEASLSNETKLYSGWYEPNSPRMQLFSFLERLIGMTYIHFKDNTLLMASLTKTRATFLPVTADQFRYVSRRESQDVAPTLMLLHPNAEGQFIQLNWGLKNPSINVTLKRIPTWLAVFEIAMVGFVLLAFIVTLIFMPFWILQGLFKKYRSSVKRSILIGPCLAILSLLSIFILCLFSNMDVVISRMGNLTLWSFSLYLATLIFAAASVASVAALWRTPKSERQSIIYLYATGITTALTITAFYLTYWGVIGLRTWV